MTVDEAIIFRKKIEMASAWTDDADALECIELFPQWAYPKSYIGGERIQHKSLLYRCIQPHTSQEDWAPDVTPALWARVSIEEYPQWIQPTGSADAYQSGNKVTHNDKHWVSNIDNNVWEPGVYGWNEV